MSVATVIPDAPPAAEPLNPESADNDESTHLHRQAIGYLGLALPVLLLLINGVRPTETLARWGPLDSVSGYYYTSAVAAFVGVLIALAVYLFTYRGYGDEREGFDLIAAWIAGASAVLVAFFPTEARNDTLALSWWTEETGTVHFVSAAVLFLSFSFFSLFQFPRSKTAGPLSRDKRVRNIIYRVCGYAILVCIAGALIAHRFTGEIFYPEILALLFFAVSWLTKGRAEHTAAVAGKRTLHYVRNPRQLGRKVAGTFRE